ncbi:MAG: pyridoxal phosphate-dependent aminotransferase [Thermoflavifilum sp.]|uniref:pyridoxal phosphate-dependent aminotransferase n=1 Tax=Thermoflavifilum sp. TaxID=1968839 RepID=UPI0018A45802|nr:pyridoxal phosphate-dependent aminotransferase [Thermoflavifilum sp.]QOR75263.1 MAG: pyridoxal phosphate-dependent aminotransferase [Thermoflavifilum sp.]
MLPVSRRALQMPASPIRKLVPFAEQATRKGIHIHYLNIGQPDIKTPPAILQAIKDAQMDVLAYSHSAGNYHYREKLTQYYKQLGIEISADKIIVTTGGSEAILFAMMTCLDPGDEVLIPEPCYANYLGFAAEAGIQVKPVPSSIETGFALPDREAFEQAIGPRTRAMLICNPNNPTGHVYSIDELRVVEDICREHQLFLFSDEAYREFCYEGTHYSALNLSSIREQVILLDTISKRYSACGARIGALISHHQEVIASALKYAQARLSPPTLEQIGAAAALDLPPDYFDATRKTYLQRRNTLVQLLNEMPGVFCPMPQGAFYAMARLPVKNADDFCQWILESFSYEGETVMMAPGAGFYATPGLGLQEVRIAYVLEESSLIRAMKCLKLALEQYPDRCSR